MSLIQRRPGSQAARQCTASAAAMVLLCAAGAATAADPVSLYKFGGWEGAVPSAGLVAAPDGYFYSSTSFGGIGATEPGSGYGTIFRIKADGSGFAPIHAFNGSTEGTTPQAPLLRGTDGALYGATPYGMDSASYGTIFRLQTDGGFSVLHTFNGLDGQQVLGGLAQDSAGVLYGTAAGGGSLGFGLVFSLRSDGTGFKVLHEFDVGPDGFKPQGGLTLGQDGRLYGTTAGDWAYAGTVFSLARDGSDFRILHRFDWQKNDGAAPSSRLITGRDGSFYGTTSGGGAYCDCGTLFKIDAAGNFKTLHSFARDFDGTGVWGAPVIGPDGNLYGTTSFGGPSPGSFGALWKIDTKGNLLGLQPFTASINLGQGALSFGADGQLYGTSARADFGTVYKFDLAAFPPPPAPMVPGVEIVVQPRQVKAGGRAVLSWAIVDMSESAACSASGAWNRLPPRRERQLVVAPQAPGEYAYTLTCTNAAGTATASAKLKVVAP